MGSTKIINVLKDDKFEELLSIVKETEASEVIFVMPKNSKALRVEDQFSLLNKERGSKSISFLCSDPTVNNLAKKYKFDVLSETSEKTAPKPIRPKLIKQKFVTPVLAKITDDDMKDGLEEDKSKEPVESSDLIALPDDEAEEEIEKDAPYGTETDESGDPIYDEEGEIIEGRAIVASAKTRGMNDVVATGPNKNLKTVQKDKRPAKVATRKESDDDIQSVWNEKWSDSLWSDASKPKFRSSNFFKKINLPKKPASYGLGLAVVVIICVAALIIFLNVGSAKIEISPRSQELNTQLKIAISPNFSSVDVILNQIPGQLFSINKKAANEFPATEEKDAIQKSRGMITIFNEYSTSPQPLVATTRFEFIQDDKESGLVFRTLQSVVVPGMKVENGIITAGEKDIEVVADKAGQAYNIAPGSFGIMAWREKSDIARYEKIYGKSSESMHGGILGKAKVVSEFDYNNAKEQLSNKVKNEINESLKLQSAGLELLTNVEPQIAPIESTAKSDDAADNFTMTVNGSIITVGFKKDDLFKLVSQYIEKTSGLVVVSDKLELSYKDIVMDETNKILRVKIDINGDAYAKIDKEEVIAGLAGKNEIQIKEYLSSFKDVDSAKVTLSPFWVKKIPKNQNKIDLSLTF